MLEICCGSYYDAVQAASGGAKRIELNSGLHLGGLTPSLGTLELVKENCQIRTVAMVRPRGGGFHYCRQDFEVMERDARILVSHGADGIAFGCLNEDASINRWQNERLAAVIHEYGKEAVFHRAFDCTRDPYRSIELLIDMGIDRVLTSGLAAKAEDGAELLKELQARYGQEIEILAGSGIHAGNAGRLMADTGITQVHSSCKDWAEDPTTIVNGVSYAFAGTPHEAAYDVVSKDLVSKLLESIGEAEQTPLHHRF